MKHKSVKKDRTQFRMSWPGTRKKSVVITVTADDIKTGARERGRGII